MLGKRSLLDHMQKIDFDFYKLTDISFKSMLGHFVPFHIALDILMAYLDEGVKILYRYTYAIMKQNKQFIKTLKDPHTFIQSL